MAFCPNCGKEVKDGEVCSCQQGKKPVINQAAVNAQVDNISGNVKNIVLAPAQGIKSFVNTAEWLHIAILAVLQFLFIIVFRFFEMIKANAKYVSSLKKSAKKFDVDYKEYIDELDINPYIYSFGDFVKEFFERLIITAAVIAITAVLVYFFSKLIKKVQVSWQVSFATATVTSFVIIPSTVMIYFAINSFDEDSRTSVYTTCATLVAVAFLRSFITFLVDNVFFN